MKIINLPNINKITPLISGMEMGIPINLITKISVNSNFADFPINNEIIILNFLLGFCTYKQDRYLDSLEFKNDTLKTSTKKKYYLSILSADKYIQLSLFSCYISLIILIIYYKIGILFPLYSTTFLYKNLKKDKNLSFLKPFYVATMWTYCSCCIPLIINNNIEISNIEFYKYILPVFLNLFSLTNFADLKDFEEDNKNDINTLAIRLGVLNTKKLILCSSIISTIFFINSPYYENSYINLFYLSSNLLPYLTLYNITENIN